MNKTPLLLLERKRRTTRSRQAVARVSGWRHNSSRKNSSSGAFGSAQARRVFAGPGRPRFSRRRLACGAGQLAPGHEGAKQWRTKAPAEGERGGFALAWRERDAGGRAGERPFAGLPGRVAKAGYSGRAECRRSTCAQRRCGEAVSDNLRLPVAIAGRYAPGQAPRRFRRSARRSANSACTKL